MPLLEYLHLGPSVSCWEPNQTSRREGRRVTVQRCREVKEEGLEGVQGLSEEDVLFLAVPGEGGGTGRGPQMKPQGTGSSLDHLGTPSYADSHGNARPPGTRVSGVQVTSKKKTKSHLEGRWKKVRMISFQMFTLSSCAL